MRLAALLLLLLLAAMAGPAHAVVPPVLRLTPAHPANRLERHLTLLAAPLEAGPAWAAVRSGALDDRFQPYNHPPPYQTTCWVRARLQSAAATTWVLELAGAGFRHNFDVYVVGPDGRAQHFPLRADQPQAGREVPTRYFSLRLPLVPGAVTDLYVRTERGGTFAFTVTERDTLRQRVAGNDLFDGLYLGLLLGLVLYNLLLFFAVGDRGYLYYVVFTAAFGLVQVAAIGWWGVVFGGGLGVDAPWQIPYLLLTVVMASALLAARYFLELPQRRPGLDRWLRWALWPTLLPLATIFTPRLAEVFPLSILQLVVSLLILGATISQFRAGYRPARYLLVGWGLLLVAIIIYSLRGMGLLPWNWISTYGVRVASAIETILFSLGLADRINLARRDRLAALHEKEALQAAANQALAARAEELQRAYTELQASLQTTDRLQSLDEAKTRFFTNISHELRTPLTLILGPLEDLMQAPPAGAEAGTLQLMHRQASQLLELINQLLDVARLEARQLTLQLRPVALDDLLRLHVGAFASAATARGLDLALVEPNQSLGVLADPGPLGQIINNLVANALKFTPAGGQVRVTAAATPTHAVLTVADTGPGIAAEHLPHLFDRFYQVDDSLRRAHGGSGIGLALVKELVELHQGTVDVASTVGVGTCFTVRLPVAALDDEAGKEPADQLVVKHITDPDSRPAAGEPPPPDDGPLRPLVLIVDDHADMRTYLSSCLAAEYRVLAETDGEAALARIAETVPDLVISDLMMPRLDGLAFCRHLKTDERTSHIPVVLLTARSDDASYLAGLELGADDYLTKPFSAIELRARVRNLLRQRALLRARFGRQVSLDPREISVTPADEAFLQKVLALAEKHLADPAFDVEVFAATLAMSRIQLYRKLKALTDQSPTDFLRTFRLRRAAQLLAGGQGPVADVAYAVGFNSLSYFAKCFREQFGHSPSEHLARAQAGVAGGGF